MGGACGHIQFHSAILWKWHTSSTLQRDPADTGNTVSSNFSILSLKCLATAYLYGEPDFALDYRVRSGTQLSRVWRTRTSLRSRIHPYPAFHHRLTGYEEG